MSRKNILYIVAIVVLGVINLALLFSDDSVGTSSFDDDLFLIEDTAAIQSVQIMLPIGENALNLTDQGWQLNNRYKVDEGFRSVLFSLLNKVRVKRRIEGLVSETEGSVKVTFSDGSERAFEFTSDPLKTRSFFVYHGDTYEMEVPGYSDQVNTIFSLTEDQWRDRMILDGSWRTIQRLVLQGEEQLEIVFNNQFFEVAGLVVIDSNAVVGYLNQFQYFQANEMVSPGKFPELDSLLGTTPLAVLGIEDIKWEGVRKFMIYPSLPGQRYHLVTDYDQSMMVISKPRMDQILRKKSDFVAK